MISSGISATAVVHGFLRQVGNGLIVIFLSIQPAYSLQTDSCLAGVFISEDDFVNNHLSYKINTAAEGHKLNFSFPADLTLTLKIITPDTTFKFAHGTIYGISECGSIYRYSPGGKDLNAQEDFYKIEEAGGLIIYSSLFISGDEIFYSTSLTSSIRRLTLENLKEDFEDYPDFIAELKKMKRQAESLAARDKDGFRIMDLYTEMVSSIE